VQFNSSNGEQNLEVQPLPMLLDSRQLAKQLSVSLTTVNRMRSSGKLPRPVKVNGNSIRYATDTVARWIKEGCPNLADFEALSKQET